MNENKNLGRTFNTIACHLKNISTQAGGNTNKNRRKHIFLQRPKLPISLHERSIKLICHKVLQASIVIKQLIALRETLQLKLNYYNFADR